MKKEQKYRADNNKGKPALPDILPDSRIKWKKSKKEIWQNIESAIEEKPEARSISLRSTFLRISAAASVILIVGAALFMRYYTRTVFSQPGELAQIELPGGSNITLNASTEIKYKPLWWFMNREVEMKGEVFFDVTKGKEFTVLSETGKTTVLGTSFNIYSRDRHYEVKCYTGKVSVESVVNGEKIIIEQNQVASLSRDGTLSLNEASSVSDSDWRTGLFRFTSSPIKRVLDEISRQYGVEIEGTEGLDLLYTGSFTRDQSPAEALNIVCRAFGLEFVKEDDNTYRIVD
ncbi:MAG: FecR domain-containing protein [Bacteroidales bacterium]|nr:FecR domain-containing protein [Bacteroidales bacterium]